MTKLVSLKSLLLGCLLILMTVGFFYRLAGLSFNYSFWIDETSSASFARAILDRGKPVLPTGYAANDYTLHFYLIAASFHLLGQTEFAARIPSVIFGTLTILVVFFLGKHFTGYRVGLVSAFLTTFSILEITYSRQARSYQELQFFSLLTITAFFILLSAYDKQRLKLFHILFFIFAFILSALTHKFALLFLFSAAGYFVLIRSDIFKRYFYKLINAQTIQILWIKVILLALTLTLLLFVLQYINFYKALQESTINFWSNKFGFSTRQYLDIVFGHIKYYHSFFWRQYPHLTLLAFLGIILGLLKNFRLTAFFIIFIIIQFGFVTLRVFPQFVRYIYLIFPLLLILASYFLVWTADNLSATVKKQLLSVILIAVFAVFLVVNGNKFSFLPKTFYSLNSDMSEIPEPDFKSVYQKISDLVNLDREKIIIIDNRPDSAEWYLGEGKLAYYLVGPDELEPRWNLDHNIKKDPVSGALYLTTLQEFKDVQNKNKKGFIILEEKSIEYVNLDRQVVDYIRKNLKKEIRIEHLEGNDLSIWPIELYSWGI